MFKKIISVISFLAISSFASINYKVVPKDTLNLDTVQVSSPYTFKDTVKLIDTVTADSLYILYNLNFSYTKPPIVHDTVTKTVTVRDTVVKTIINTVHDTLVKVNTVFDTVTLVKLDTLVKTVHDTVFVTNHIPVYDTIIKLVEVHDTTIVLKPIADTSVLGERYELGSNGSVQIIKTKKGKYGIIDFLNFPVTLFKQD